MLVQDEPRPLREHRCGKQHVPQVALGLLAAAIGLLGLPNPSASEVQVWSILRERSDVRISVGKSGLLSVAGHTHEVVAPAVSGEIRFDPQQLERAEIKLTFDAAALRVTGAGEPAKDVAEVQRTMLSDKVLAVRMYPTITFQSQQIEVRSRAADQARLLIVGTLTLHGVTHRVVVPVEVKLGSKGLTATGQFAIKQTNFKMEPVSAGLGTVKVKDDVSVRFTLAAEARGAGAV